MIGEGNKYSTHVLELVRNNGISGTKDQTGQGFLMFDYFDILIHEELCDQKKQYVNYFSIGDTFHDERDYKVSFKTLNLYCYNEDDRNPFAMPDSGQYQNPRALSETPFLGLIQISLCKENYVRESREPVDIDAFLTDCGNKILQIVEETGEYGQGDPTVRQLYRSSTTGDFCLVIRTDSVEKIYSIALGLNDSQNNSRRELKVRTYTNVGIECRIISDGEDQSYATLSDDFVTRHAQLMIALRFSADKGLMPTLEKYQKNGNEIRMETVKGLFGRYDYLLHINLKEFAQIYPILCEKKFGSLSGTFEGYQEGVSTLRNIFRYPHIKNINERILVELSALKGEKEDEEADSEYLSEVLNKNKELFGRISRLSNYRSCFAEEDRTFRDLHRGMVGIYKTFSAIGMEKDAYINWLIFCRDIDILCGCLEAGFKKYKKICKDESAEETKKRAYRLGLLRDWRINIQALNQYTKLVQNINYQTYQSPIYEIQTQIDTEKTMIAYRQAMMSYMDSYMEAKDLENKDVIPSLPIIYPDLAKGKVEVIAPFSNPANDGEMLVKREIMCTVPSFEYFGRLYDLLPLMIHECSHHIRILSREERNLFFIEYVFSYVYGVFLEDALPGLADDVLYNKISRVEQRIIDSMVKVTVDEFAEKTERRNGKEYFFKDFAFVQVIGEIDAYLGHMFSQKSAFAGTQAGYDIKETRDKIYDFFLSEYRKEELLGDGQLERILDIKKGIYTGEKDELGEPLLKEYFEQVKAAAAQPVKEDEGIMIGDLWVSQKWFEKRLSEVNRKLKERGVSADALKEYQFRLIKLYRVMRAYAAMSRKENAADNTMEIYLKKVFAFYQKESEKNDWKKEDEIFWNPAAVHVLRSLGLLNQDEDMFCSQMKELIGKTNYNEIIRHKELKTKVYREAFADLLMATSLNIDSFGYCRQVLQTVSDAWMEEKGYWHDDINNQRFQIVAAVLLEEDLMKLPGHEKMIARNQEIDRIRLDGRHIVNKGMVYCEYTLKCLRENLFKTDEIKGDMKMARASENFIDDIEAQLKLFLGSVKAVENYRSTYLYVLLHGRNGADEGIVEMWDQEGYKKVANACRAYKYVFWRLEYFCLGLKNIMKNDSISIPLKLFDHMMKIRKKIKKEDGGGCRWETDWACLSESKMDVGEFYNDPKQVYEKKSAHKLENTIDFIQNYYYYNRFRMMEKEMGYNDGRKEG